MKSRALHARPQRLLRDAAVVGAGALLASAALVPPASAHEINNSGSRRIEMPITVGLLSVGVVSQTIPHACPPLSSSPMKCTPNKVRVPVPDDVSKRIASLGVTRALVVRWSVKGNAEGVSLEVKPATCSQDDGSTTPGTSVGVSSKGGEGVITLGLWSESLDDKGKPKPEKILVHEHPVTGQPTGLSMPVCWE